MNAEQSKYLSYLLRHKPESANLGLDKNGWCPVQELIQNAKFTLEELQEIVRDDAKTRYALSEDGTKIRANQGHSTSKVRLTYNKAVPPVMLYHGTTTDGYEFIQKEGLKPMNRHHVHLTDDRDTAVTVAGRRKTGIVILKIDAKKMLADGVQFFLSPNNVWLVTHVAPKYIKKLKSNV